MSSKLIFWVFRKIKVAISGGFHKNPLFYFGFGSFALLSLLVANSGSLAELSNLKGSNSLFLNNFFRTNIAQANNDLFFNQNDAPSLESPDLKIIQNGFLSAVSTPTILSTQTLGAILGSSTTQPINDITDYTVQEGDTLQSIADNFNISLNTILWANNLSKNSRVKPGQTLTILPVTGIAHVAKSGDTVSDIARTYKASADDVIAFNGLAGEGDIFIGDVLIVPNGTMPAKPIPSIAQTPLADNYFIFPLLKFKVTQGLHFSNAIDIAPLDSCGTPVYAAAAGIVQRVKYGYNFGGGNYITILHPNGVATYYGHLMSMFVESGDKVDVGQRIGLVGGGRGMQGAGISTGCHTHFQVTGAKNFLSKYAVGTIINNEGK